MDVSHRDLPGQTVDFIVEIDVAIYGVTETSAANVDPDYIKAIADVWMYLRDSREHECKAIARPATRSAGIVKEIANTTLQYHQSCKAVGTCSFS